MPGSKFPLPYIKAKYLSMGAQATGTVLNVPLHSLTEAVNTNVKVLTMDFLFLFKSVCTGAGKWGSSNGVLRETSPVRLGDAAPFGTPGYIHTWVYLADRLMTKLPEQEMQLLYSELDKLQMKKMICQVFQSNPQDHSLHYTLLLVNWQILKETKGILPNLPRIINNFWAKIK